MVADLTGLGAGERLDATRHRRRRGDDADARASKSKSNGLIVDVDVFAQTAAILATRAEPLGIEIVTADLRDGRPDGEMFGVLVQLPGASGSHHRPVGRRRAGARAPGALVAVGADLLAMTVVVAWRDRRRRRVRQRPAIRRADGFGGPHAGYLCVHAKHARQLPGRWSGFGDADGKTAYRLTPADREQHIRRDKPTNQHLHRAGKAAGRRGRHVRQLPRPDGLTNIAARVHRPRRGRPALGDALVRDKFFDTVLGPGARPAEAVVAATGRHGAGSTCAGRRRPRVGMPVTETTTAAVRRCRGLGVRAGGRRERARCRTCPGAPVAPARTSAFLTHPAFHHYRTAAMMRYLRAWPTRIMALDRTP